MDPFDEMSDRRVTWLDIGSTLIILAFLLGSLALVGLFAGSPHNGAPPGGSEAAVFDAVPQIVPGPATAEEDEAERRMVARQ